LKPANIVGIVASAGGLEAVSSLVRNLPKDVGAAYVIAQHMSPNYKSLLTTLISRETSLPVREIRQEEDPEPDTIYVTPPNSDVIFEDGLLKLVPPSGHHATPKPSGDRLLKSLAESCEEHCVGIILSGTGSDGSYGVQAVREACGVTIAQDPVSAKYDGMPNSAIETGCIDLTLPPEMIGQHLTRILSLPRDLDALRVETTPPHKLTDLMQILLARTRVDFRDYKETTVKRRINRRMAALGITDYDEYVSHCRADIHEVDALHRDLLISVTRFFRDPEQFEQLREIIADLVESVPHSPYRIWVPGAATGEEAYSIAILFAEALGGPQQLRKNRLQIFATDIDARALELARSGTYPLAALNDIPEEYQSAYFKISQDRLEVSQDLRSVVLFSEHNVFQDPPFLNLDLVSIRNVLIYFNTTLQERVLDRIHYALADTGLLFLGTSESVSVLDAFFEHRADTDKIFAKRRLARHQAARRDSAAMLPGIVTPLRYRRDSVDAGASEARDKAAFESLLGVVAPLGFLATRNGEIVRVMGDLSPFIELSAGSNLRMTVRLLRRGLRDDAANLIAITHRSGERRRSTWISLDGPASTLEARLICFPLRLPDAGEETFVMAIETRPLSANAAVDIDNLSDQERRAYLQQVETEMSSTREALQQTVEELQTSNEELQSTNEELQSTNEELQATNEELETANEELQSTNEELITVNEEMQINAAELHRVTAELQATFASTPFPMLMVDQALQIRQASQGALAFLGIDALPVAGLHLSQCQLPEGLPSATRLCNDALRKRETQRALLTTLDEVIEVTAVPFDSQHQESQGLTISIQSFDLSDLNTMMTLMDRMAGVSHWMLDVPSQRVFWSPGVFRVHGLREEAGEPDYEKALDFYHPEDRALVAAAVSKAIETRSGMDFEARLVRADDGRVVPVRALGMCLTDSSGSVVKMVGAFCDLSETVEKDILIDHFNTVQDVLGIGFFSYDILNNRPYWSRGLYHLLGYDPDTHEPSEQSGLEMIHPDDRARVDALLSKAIDTGEGFEYEARLVGKDGNVLTCAARGNVRRTVAGVPTHVYGSFQIVHKAKSASKTEPAE
jgi:chemotaxis protein methyltransferase CheR/two-component system CheB/CheR fusion protein